MVGPMPPPITGPGVMMQDMAASLAPISEVTLVDVGPGPSARGAAYYLTRVARTAAAVVRIFGDRRRAGTVYLSADGGPGLCLNAIVAAAARLFGYRVFLHHHSYAYITATSRLAAGLFAVMGDGGVHIVLSETMERRLKQSYPSVKIAMTMGAGSALPPVERPMWRSRTPLAIGFLSNLIPEKGFDTVIDLVRRGREQGLAIRLILAGRIVDAIGEKIVRAAEAELGAALEYRGALSDAEKHQFFLDIDAFAFPSRYRNEARPRVVNEALAFGVPVLTTAVGSIPDMMRADCGACIDPDRDFAELGLEVIREWVERPDSHRDVVAAAMRRGAELHQEGLKEATALCSALAWG